MDVKPEQYLKKDEIGVKIRLYRKLAIPVSKILAKTCITPNQLTFIGFFGRYSWVFVLFWVRTLSFIAAAILFQLQIYFDYLDGTVARLKNMSSILGGFLDGVFHQFVFFILFFSSTLHVVFHTPSYLVSFFQMYTIPFPTTLIWSIGFLGLYNFLTIIWLKDRFIFTGKIKKMEAFEGFELKDSSQWGWKKFLLINKPFITTFFMVAFLLNIVFPALLIFALYSTLYLIAQFVYYCLRIHKMDVKRKKLNLSSRK